MLAGERTASSTWCRGPRQFIKAHTKYASDTFFELAWKEFDFKIKMAKGVVLLNKDLDFRKS